MGCGSLFCIFSPISGAEMESPRKHPITAFDGLLLSERTDFCAERYEAGPNLFRIARGH